MKDPADTQTQDPQPQIKPQPTAEELSIAAMAKVEASATPEPEPAPQPSATAVADITAKYQESVINAGKQEKKERDLKAQIAQLTKQNQDFEEMRQSLADPERRLKFMQSQGISYKDIVTDMAAATEDPKTPEQLENDKLRATVAELTAWKTQTETAQVQHETKTQQDSAYEYGAQFLEKNKDKYPRMAALKSSQRLVDEYQRQHRETGIEPDEHEVAKYMEDFATKNLDAQISRLREYGILSGKPDQNLKIEPEPAQQATSLSGQPKPQTAADRLTLTNDMSAAPSGALDYDEILRREGPHSQTLQQIAIRRAEEKNAAT